MKRIIEFKGKCIKNGVWRFGSLIEYGDNQFNIVPNGRVINDSHSVIPESIGQFIGCFDMIGKKIYEGDIVYHRSNCVIEWRYDFCRFDFKYNTDLMSPQWMNVIDPTFSKRELMVVGNIND